MCFVIFGLAAFIVILTTNMFARLASCQVNTKRIILTHVLATVSRVPTHDRFVTQAIVLQIQGKTVSVIKSGRLSSVQAVVPLKMIAQYTKWCMDLTL